MSDLSTPARVVAALLKPYRRRVLLAAIALVVAALSMLGVGQGLRAVIDRGFSAGDPAWLDRALMAMFGIISLLAAATYLRFYNVSWLGERVTADLRRRVFDHLLALPPSYFEQGRTGAVISSLTADTALIENAIGSTLSIALRNTLILIGGLAMLFTTNLKLTLMVLAGVPLVVAPIVLFGRRVRRLARVSQDRVADLGNRIDETIHEIRIVQAYGHEDAAGEDHRLLRHQRHALAYRQRIGCRQRNTVKAQASGLRIVKAQEQLEYRRLAGARGPTSATLSPGATSRLKLASAGVSGREG